MTVSHKDSPEFVIVVRVALWMVDRIGAYG